MTGVEQRAHRIDFQNTCETGTILQNDSLTFVRHALFNKPGHEMVVLFLIGTDLVVLSLKQQCLLNGW